MIEASFLRRGINVNWGVRTAYRTSYVIAVTFVAVTL